MELKPISQRKLWSAKELLIVPYGIETRIRLLNILKATNF